MLWFHGSGASLLCWCALSIDVIFKCYRAFRLLASARLTANKFERLVSESALHLKRHRLDFMMKNLDIKKQTGLFPARFVALASLVFFIAALAALPADAALRQPTIIIPDSAFIEAVRDGDQEQVEAALVRGQAPDARDKVGTPALFVALQYRQMDMFKFLIEKGARIRLKDRNGDTLLAVLADTKYVSLADLILSLGADPDQYGSSGEPPIIIAARAGELEMIRLLLRYDVDYDATDLTGRGALTIAEEGRFSAIVELLREVGAY